MAAAATTTRLSAPSPTLRAAASRVTAAAGATGTRDAAVALYRHVRDAVTFGFTGAFDGASPEATLAAGRGHCTPKAALLAALLNTLDGVSAATRFVRLDGGVLRGVLGDGAPPTVVHSYVEVRGVNGGGGGGGEPLRLDGFVVDAPLAAAAAARLAVEGASTGYGVHAGGRSDWDGRTDCFIQMADEAAQVSRDWGLWDEPAKFLDSDANPQRLPLLVRPLFWVPASLINRRIDRLRRGV